MPGVLRVVFRAAVPGQMGLSGNVLFLIDLQTEVQLFL